MNMKMIGGTACLGIAGLLLAGCVSVHKVTIKDAPRHPASFESAEAMQTFYDALLARHFPKDGKPSRVRAGQTIYTSETRPSADAAFNDGIAAADADGNGIISAREAAAYAALPAK